MSWPRGFGRLWIPRCAGKIGKVLERGWRGSGEVPERFRKGSGDVPKGLRRGAGTVPEVLGRRCFAEVHYDHYDHYEYFEVS